MSINSPNRRRLSHTRNIRFQGFEREDGLWDIEAELIDVKPYPFELPSDGLRNAGEPIHRLRLRLAVDEQLVVREVAGEMAAIPHPECADAPAPLQRLIGCTLGPGWRQAIERHMGGVQGCTHLREMLFNMATAAYQTVPAGLAQRRLRLDEAEPRSDGPPHHLGKCLSWDFDGPLVQRAYPMFWRQDPKKKAPPPTGVGDGA